MSHIIAPSALAADFGNLERDIKMINESDADWLHIDIMDGQFVPNISYGPSIMSTMNRFFDRTMDVHLMIHNPQNYITIFKDAGADIITVHYEACDHLHRVIYQIKDLGLQAGVAINPHTSVELLSDVVEDADLFLIMSVNPGFGGQKFIYNTLNKVKRLKAMIIEKNSNALIEVDGGVGLQNAESLIAAGADALVAGSSVFKSDNPVETVKRLKSISSKNYVGF